MTLRVYSIEWHGLNILCMYIMTIVWRIKPFLSSLVTRSWLKTLELVYIGLCLMFTANRINVFDAVLCYSCRMSSIQDRRIVINPLTLGSKNPPKMLHHLWGRGGQYWPCAECSTEPVVRSFATPPPFIYCWRCLWLAESTVVSLV